LRGGGREERKGEEKEKKRKKAWCIFLRRVDSKDIDSIQQTSSFFLLYFILENRNRNIVECNVKTVKNENKNENKFGSQ